MFLRKYWIPLSVFIVAIASVGLYMLATQPPKDPIVIYKPVEPIEKPTQQQPAEAPSEINKGGHVHADGTWHDEPHETQPATPHSSEIAQGNPNTDLITDIPSIDAEKLSEHQQGFKQYIKDREQWLEKIDRAHIEWMQSTDLGGKSAEEWQKEIEYVQSLSDAEKQERIAKLQAKLERVLATSQNLRVLMKEEPVYPQSSQTN